MSFFSSLPEDAGPPHVFRAYPELHHHWSDMSQVLMNGSSPLSPAEREMILAFAADVAGCPFAYIAHCGVAYAWGVEEGLIDKPLDDLADAPVEVRLKPLLAFVRKLTLKLSEMTPADADAIFDAGWQKQALHDSIPITARMCFMQRLAEGHRFKPWTKDAARKHAEQRVKPGYFRHYPELSEPDRRCTPDG